MSTNRQRVSLEMSDAVVRRLDELVVLCGVATRAELVRRALEAYDYVVDARVRGERLVFQLDGRERELAIPLPAGVGPSTQGVATERAERAQLHMLEQKYGRIDQLARRAQNEALNGEKP